MADKLVNNLPVVLQTTAIKNFFESTVEQLYSQANTTVLSGYIGKKTGDDTGLSGAFIDTLNPDRFHYAFSPAVNNLNPITGESENVIFYDEFIDILKTYGVNVRNHNTLFGSNYQTFMPPINVDKFINHAEYFWSLTGPSVVTITMDQYNPINIEKDIIGKKEYTFVDGTTSPNMNGKKLRNGMVISFVGNYVIPSSYIATNYIVGGVGESIYLTKQSISNRMFGAQANQEYSDYMVIERGSVVGSAWSRCNHWYHRNNFLDVGDTLPDKKYRAQRPIIEFDRRIEMYNHGTNYRGEVDLFVTENLISDIQGQSTFTIDNVDLTNNMLIVFDNESETNKNIIYKVSGVGSSIALTAEGAVLATGDTFNIKNGINYSGIDYLVTDAGFQQAQNKTNVNQAPLFNLYDDKNRSLNNLGIYPSSSFDGCKIFSYKVGTGTNDSVLGFPLSYSQFKSASEISFENCIETASYNYKPFGSSTNSSIKGAFYYKLLGNKTEYHSYWKTVDALSRQKIHTTYTIDANIIEDKTLIYDIGAVPNTRLGTPSGYDIIVKKNSVIISDYTYNDGNIVFSKFDFKNGDIIEIEVVSDDGLRLINNSRYDIPLSWRNNPDKNDIEIIAEPQYLPHFKRFVESQDGFAGDALASNNFDSSPKDLIHATDITMSNDNLILGAFLLDDQPHNLLESIRFVGREYEKFKNRLKSEIQKYYNTFDTSLYSNEYLLEKVLRNTVSYSIGKGVFATSYILPYGDNFVEQTFDVTDVAEFEYTLDEYKDVALLENTALVYYKAFNDEFPRILLLDDEYTFSSTNPITVQLDSSKFTLSVGDTIIVKLYDENRDSAECPPTPSAMGIYPLHQPRIETDSSYQTPIDVVIGHDGSKTPTVGNITDDILLEFEKRIYNSCQKQFRDANSLPKLNTTDVRAGYFRDTDFEPKEYADLLRHNFIIWSSANKTDYQKNEFFDQNDKWTWNYRGNIDLPGHWRGWYNYYYDTVRPHTHPWEMLGFFEKPTWWDTQYGTDYTALNESMWNDLELGIIRQGPRENFADESYKIKNNFARPGLSNLLPVTKTGTLLSPGEISSNGSTTNSLNWSNARVASLDITDQFYDSQGHNNLPNGINVTYGTGTSARITWDTTGWDTVGVGFDSFQIANIYIRNDNIESGFQLYNYTFEQMGNSSIVPEGVVAQGFADELGDNFVGVTVTGVPIYSLKDENKTDASGTWHENPIYRNETAPKGTYIIEPKHAGLEEWSTTEHSPIVGFAWDGLPIYGPYGYADAMDSSSGITNIKSVFRLKSGTRSSGPGGYHTGEYLEDYEYDATDDSADGFVGFKPGLAKYNMRYGVTPESPTTPIYYYVTTVDYNGNPMFPYAFGGIKDSTDAIWGSSEPYTWSGKYYAVALKPEENNAGNITTVGELNAITSTYDIVTTVTGSGNLISNDWKFGDGAPVENAWKYSSSYPFAITEALLLAKPGRFVTLFADPTNTETPPAESFKLINKTDREIFKFKSADHFRIHGDLDANNDTIINTGYTQFIHSWLTYQGLNTKTDFVDKIRTVNTKLSHRVEGFTDKDTLKVRSDQFSSTSTRSSLIIPNENIEITIHSSPYKNRNFYSGVIVQKIENGYKVKGYDKNLGYFNTLKPNKFGPTSSFEVGGEAVEFVPWEPLTAYQKGTIVAYQDRFYRAPTFVTSSESFISSLWQSLSGLPTRGSVKGVIYQESLPEVVRVEYDTVFATHQEVFEFLIALGNYHESLGFDFGGFDVGINDARNWTYAGKQFLFWIAGGWQNNNTIELSPMATKVAFESETGFIAKVNRIERSQFNLIDQNGKAIQPTECEIVRVDNRIEVIPPSGTQIYGCLLYTKEIEHALTVDNLTEFNDTIYNPLYNQKQNRLRLKGKKTANWDGRFSSEGFIIQGDELKPNLDNMAQSLGRYHELGFVPVEKHLYERARGLFGYTEKSYLSDLEMDDDTQFEFYSGMIREKGTIPSLQKISKSNNIIQGNMTIFDEWAVKVGDFGDLENDQAIELKIDRDDIVSDPQLITLAFPEDTTGVVDKINVVSTSHRYHSVPSIEINQPIKDPKITATAKAVLNSAGEISSIEVTNEGSGYEQTTGLNIIASNILISDTRHLFKSPQAQSTAIVSDNLSGMTLSNITITDHFGNANVDIDVSSASNLYMIADAINNNADVNANIKASFATFNMVVEGDYDVDEIAPVNVQGRISIVGSDFTLTESGTTLSDLNLTPGRYQPKQSFSIDTFDAKTDGTGSETNASHIAMTINGTAVPSDNGNNWVYDHGSRTALSFVTSGIPNSQKIIPGSGGLVSPDTVYSGNITLISPFNNKTFNVDANNIVATENIYPHVDVYVNGDRLVNTPDWKRYEFLSSTSLKIYDVGSLKNKMLAAGANIYIKEHSTITLNENYQGDLPNATIRIKVTATDNITALVKSKRIYEITPDVKNDDTILIDIDDNKRFLKKPLGVKENGLWPTTANIDWRGAVDEKFREIPNAGYVHKANVDFRAFRPQDIRSFFVDTNLVQPDEGHTIHVAKSENKTWNVYQLKNIEANTSYIENEAGQRSAYLYTDKDLFEYTDNNQIHDIDTGRFLDYHLIVKDTNLNEKFVVWTNQEVVNAKQVRISNLSSVKMVEANIVSIAPSIDSTYEITNFSSTVSKISSASAAALANNTVRITAATDGLFDGSTVSFGSALGNTFPLYGNTFVVGNVEIGRFTVSLSNAQYNAFVTTDWANQGNGIVDVGNLVLETRSKTLVTSVDHPFLSGQKVKITDAGTYNGVFNVESATANTFIINVPYYANTATTGNIVTKNLKITFDKDLGITGYTGKIGIHNFPISYYNKVVNAHLTRDNYMQVLDLYPWQNKTSYANFTLTANANIATLGDITGELITQANSGATAIVVGQNDSVLTLQQVNGSFTYKGTDTLSSNVTGTLNAYPTKVSTQAVVSTLDHDVINPNFSTIKLDNIKSADGMVESFNRRQAMMRAWLGYRGSFSMNFPWLDNPTNIPGGINNTAGGTPYVTNQVLNSGAIDMTDIAVTGQITSNPIANDYSGFNLDFDSESIPTTFDPSSYTNSQPTPIKIPDNFNPLGLPSYLNPVTPGVNYSSTGTSSAVGPDLTSLQNWVDNYGTQIGSGFGWNFNIDVDAIQDYIDGLTDPADSNTTGPGPWTDDAITLTTDIKPIDIPIITSCPAPEMPIKISQDGKTKPAGDLSVGDVVYTAHEDTGEYGLYNVTYVEIKQEKRLKVKFDDGFEFIGSYTHKFKVGDDWVEIQDLHVGDNVQGVNIVSIEDDIIDDIVVITVEDAHTYIVGELLSHNKTFKQTTPCNNTYADGDYDPTTCLLYCDKYYNYPHFSPDPGPIPGTTCTPGPGPSGPGPSGPGPSGPGPSGPGPSGPGPSGPGPSGPGPSGSGPITNGGALAGLKSKCEQSDPIIKPEPPYNPPPPPEPPEYSFSLTYDKPSVEEGGMLKLMITAGKLDSSKTVYLCSSGSWNDYKVTFYSAELGKQDVFNDNSLDRKLDIEYIELPDGTRYTGDDLRIFRPSNNSARQKSNGGAGSSGLDGQGGLPINFAFGQSTYGPILIKTAIDEQEDYDFYTGEVTKAESLMWSLTDQQLDDDGSIPDAIGDTFFDKPNTQYATDPVSTFYDGAVAQIINSSVAPPVPATCDKWLRFFATQASGGAYGQSSGSHKYFYTLDCKGKVSLVFHGYSAGDKFSVHQVASKSTALSSSNKKFSTSLSENKVRNATTSEKDYLLASANNANSQYLTSLKNSVSKNFVREPASKDYIQYTGVIEGTLNPTDGEIVVVVVEAASGSSIYAMCVDVPSMNGLSKDALKSQNSNPGGKTTSGGSDDSDYGTGSYGTGTGYNTPIYSPTGYYTGSSYLGGKYANIWDSNNYYQNFAGWSQTPMTGFRSIPKALRKTTPTKFVSAQNYGIYKPISTTGINYSNTTSQRVSGGKVKPLATPSPRPIPLFPRAIRSRDGANTLFGSLISSIANGQDILFGIPKPITTGLPDGVPVYAEDAFSGDITLKDINFSETTPLADIPGYPGDGQDDDTLYPNITDFNYTENPVITITPTRRTDAGIHIPAGDPIFCNIYKPTPSVKISRDDVIGATPGDVLIINGESVSLPGGGFDGFAENLKCVDIPGATVTTVSGSDTDYVKISSCSNAPLTFRNGCAGSGAYSEILDFHVVKRFTQDQGLYVHGSTENTEESTTTSVPVAQTTYDSNGVATGTTISTQSSTSNKTIITQKSGTDQTQTNWTGGSGFTVGDRLRLVGGEPVPDPYGTISKICIANAGANYTHWSNVYVQIGDGTTPGQGATVAEVFAQSYDQINTYDGDVVIVYNGEYYINLQDGNLNNLPPASPEWWRKLPRRPQQIVLDPITGGIAEITLSSGGVGYVKGNLPKVTVVDIGQSVVPVTPAQLEASISIANNQVPRVAKFNVTAVDNVGSIIGLQIIDRGVYKSLPSDLDSGLPLEYDYILQGDEDDGEYLRQRDMDGDGKINQPMGSGLGQWDPLNNYALLPSPSAEVRKLFAEGGNINDLIEVKYVYMVDPEYPDDPFKGSTYNALYTPKDYSSVVNPYNYTIADGTGSTNEPNFKPNNKITGQTPYNGTNVYATDVDFSERLSIPFTLPFVQTDNNEEENAKYWKLGEFGIGSNRAFDDSTSPDGKLDIWGNITLIAWISTTPGGTPVDKHPNSDAPTYRVFRPHPGDHTRIKWSADPRIHDRSIKYPSLGDNDILDAGVCYTPGGELRFFNTAFVKTDATTFSDYAENTSYSTTSKWRKTGSILNADPGTAAFDNFVAPSTIKVRTHTLEWRVAYPASTVDASGEGIAGESIGYDPNYNAFGGGRGARLYFTSRDIPDCSEKGTLKEALGLPDRVIDVSFPVELSDMLNEGIGASPYDPADISFNVSDVNDDIKILTLDAPGYDGVEFGEITAGFLDKLGIPIGSYNHDMACMVMTNETSTQDDNITIEDIDGAVNSGDAYRLPTELKEEILTITCVDNLKTPPGTILGNANVAYIDDLYKYELRDIFGGRVANTLRTQQADVLYVESKRYSTEAQIAQANVLFPSAKIPSTKEDHSKVWIDSYNDNGNMKWAYFEDGTIKRSQKDMVDPTFIGEIHLYDSETGEKEHNLDLWDPFKGILPGMIDAEIHYISETDPVVYDTKRARFGKEQCGQTWWNTSSVRYDWYEQGPNRERWLNWGNVFPGSMITLYEWVQSKNPPSGWEGTGTPKNASEFIVTKTKNKRTGEVENIYYYWVQNKTDLSSFAKENHNRKISTFNLAKYIADPYRSGLNTISFISSGKQDDPLNPASMSIANLQNIIREDEQNLQINLSRNLNPIGLKHTAWKLLRQEDKDSSIPEDISAKLIDSLCEKDAVGSVVPASNLSEVEKYGTAFRPRQTMFKDPAEARRVMHYVLNNILADRKTETLNPNWVNTFDSYTYVSKANWYEVERVSSTNETIRYNKSSKPVYTVPSIKSLDTYKKKNLPDGTVMMIRNRKSDRYQLWRWESRNDKFSLIALENETLQIDSKVYTDSINDTMSTELRKVLEDLRDVVFRGTNLWNKFFFEMLNYAYGEQLQLDWAFKTSYVYVNKEEEDLTLRKGFKPDNFETVKEYLNEAKPYSAKVREYKDGKKTPIDYIKDQMISDFDKPPYADPVAGEVRILDLTDSDDANIANVNVDYVKWSEEYNTYGNISNAVINSSPVRTANVKMVFDRTDWKLLPTDFDASNTTYAQGTASLISYLNSNSNGNVSANSNVSMSGRIFKFDTDVRAQFAKDVANGVDAEDNLYITDVTDASQIESAYLAGKLVKTLALVKDKVGGGFRGEELDANVFTKVVPGESPLSYQTGFGWDTAGFGTSGFDTKIEVQNYEGVLQGNTTLRRSGVTYEGFDAVTFQKVLYGEERPEELALFSPLENLIVNVKTTTLAYGDGASNPATAAVALGPYPVEASNSVANVVTITTTYGHLLSNNDSITFSGGSNAINQSFAISNVSQNYSGNSYNNTSFTISLSGYTEDPTANIVFRKGGEAVDVEYIAHYNMFGDAEYIRVKGDNSTATILSKRFEAWDDELTVDDSAVLPTPRPGIPGVIWINNTERVEYRQLNKNTNKISDITRGTRGTTIQTHIQGVSVKSGYYTEIFDDSRVPNYVSQNPDVAVWLKSDGSTLSLTDITNRSSVNTIAAFLQGDSLSAVGWDIRGFEQDPWDSV